MDVKRVSTVEEKGESGSPLLDRMWTGMLLGRRERESMMAEKERAGIACRYTFLMTCAISHRQSRVMKKDPVRVMQDFSLQKLQSLGLLLSLIFSSSPPSFSIHLEHAELR